MNPAATKSESHAGKYLTVVIGEEAYGISVQKVREIIRLQKITPVPQVPDFVRGVINLRGRVIPVIDLRLKFGLNAEDADRTCIVVVAVRLRNERLVNIGVIVTSVEEVLNVTGSDIEDTPEFGVQIDTAYLLGLAKIGGKVKMLLDIDCVVSPDTASQLAALG